MISPIIDDIHKIRDEYAARFNNDLLAICQDAQKRQGLDGREIVPVYIKSPINKIKPVTV